MKRLLNACKGKHAKRQATGKRKMPRYDFEGYTNTFREGCNANNWIKLEPLATGETYILKEFNVYLDTFKCLHAQVKTYWKSEDYTLLDLYDETQPCWKANIADWGPHPIRFNIERWQQARDQFVPANVLRVILHALSPETHYQGFVVVDRIS